MKTVHELARAQGYNAHRAGDLLLQCPYETPHLRASWRKGWMEREEAFIRVAPLEQRRKAGVL